MAQSADQLLTASNVRSSNPVIGKKHLQNLFLLLTVTKTEIKKKRPGIAEA